MAYPTRAQTKNEAAVFQASLDICLAATKAFEHNSATLAWAVNQLDGVETAATARIPPPPARASTASPIPLAPPPFFPPSYALIPQERRRPLHPSFVARVKNLSALERGRLQLERTEGIGSRAARARRNLKRGKKLKRATVADATSSEVGVGVEGVRISSATGFVGVGRGRGDSFPCITPPPSRPPPSTPSHPRLSPTEAEDWAFILRLNPHLKGFKYLPRRCTSGAITHILNKTKRRIAVRREREAGFKKDKVWEQFDEDTRVFVKDRGGVEQEHGDRGVPNSKAGIFREMGAKHPNYNAEYLDHPEHYTRLLEQASLKRVMGLFTDTLREYFPSMYSLYQELASRLAQDDLHMLAGPFASLCLNTGGRVATAEHRDHLNLLPGLCGIFPSGKFNSRRGGHLVLVEAKIVVELAEGDVFLFPSAIFTHYNIPLQPGDCRNSLACWSGGSLFLWAKLGGRPKTELSAKERKEFEFGKEEMLDLLYKNFPLVL